MQNLKFWRQDKGERLTVVGLRLEAEIEELVEEEVSALLPSHHIQVGGVLVVTNSIDYIINSE